MIKAFIDNTFLAGFTLISLILFTIISYLGFINKIYIYSIRKKFMYDVRHSQKIIDKKNISTLLHPNSKITINNIRKLPSKVVFNYNTYVIITNTNIQYYQNDKLLYSENINIFIDNVNRIEYNSNYNNTNINLC